MKPWYIVASCSGESIFVDAVGEPRQNLMLRLCLSPDGMYQH